MCAWAGPALNPIVVLSIDFKQKHMNLKYYGGNTDTWKILYRLQPSSTLETTTHSNEQVRSPSKINNIRAGRKKKTEIC
jgi:hypothetical protein